MCLRVPIVQLDGFLEFDALLRLDTRNRPPSLCKRLDQNSQKAMAKEDLKWIILLQQAFVNRSTVSSIVSILLKGPG